VGHPPGVHELPRIAFATDADSPALEVRVNFGLFAGREATAAELEELAHSLLPEVGEVSVVAEQRHEVSEDTEASIHQVRIDVADEHVPTDAEQVAELARRIVAVAERWAEACIADRHTEI
jgi:predicted alpha/beta-hydrolase family hydrolase